MTQAQPSPSEIQAALKFYRQNPRKYFANVLNVETEAYQDRILDAVARHERVAVRACHDLGKTWTFARVVIWFALNHPFCKVITTAPTGRQVKHILWSEINSAYNSAKGPLGGRMLQQEWHLSETRDWFALGFSPSKEAAKVAGEGQGTQSSFQGFHASGGMLVVFDEATGIEKQIWDMAEGLLTQSNVKFICIGNPTSSQSEFYKCFKSRFWHKIHLSCFDSPNLIANGITDIAQLQREIETLRSLNEQEAVERTAAYKVVKPHLLSTRWVVERAEKWGITHPLFLSKVLGEFPTESDNVKMPLGMVETAMMREYVLADEDTRALGVDVARFGSDSTVLTYIHGKQVLPPLVLNKRSTTEVAGEVIVYCRLHGWPSSIVVDETGVGGGVLDTLREKQDFGDIKQRIPHTVQIIGVQFGEGFEAGSDDSERYANVKSKMFDVLSVALRDELALPQGMAGDIYLEELPTIIYKYAGKGQLKMESKDEYKKRTQRGSPDHADSLALANYGRQQFVSAGIFTEDFIPTVSSITGGMSSEDQW